MSNEHNQNGTGLEQQVLWNSENILSPILCESDE